MRKLKMLSVDALIPPDGWESTIDQDVVDRIAQSIVVDGLREPLVVLRSGHIVHGVHRWAAATAANIEEVECVIEAQSETPEDHASRVITENLDRRHLSRSEIRDLIAERVRLRADEIFSGKTSTKTGRATVAYFPADKKTAVREAVKEVAEKVGKTPRAVRHAVKRSADAAEDRTQVDPEKPPAPAVVGDDLGAEIPAGRIDTWDITRAQLRAIRGACKQISAHIGRLAGVRGFGSQHQRLRQAHKALDMAAKFCTPYALCPRCSGLDDKCSTCDGLGFRSERDMQNTKQE